MRRAVRITGVTGATVESYSYLLRAVNLKDGIGHPCVPHFVAKPNGFRYRKCNLTYVNLT